MTDTLAPRRVFGVLVPDFNTVVQPELEALRPAGVSNQTGRFTLDADVLENARQAAGKLATCSLDAIVVALSTESFPGGLAMLEQASLDVQKATDLPVFTASHATQAALRRLGVDRIGIVTPFDAAQNAHVREAFALQGFDVVRIEGLACPGLDAIPRTSYEEIDRCFSAADDARAQALVQVGTGLPVVHRVEALEAAHGKPVVACNAASYWQMLRETGIDDRIEGFGRLLAEC